MDELSERFISECEQDSHEDDSSSDKTTTPTTQISSVLTQPTYATNSDDAKEGMDVLRDGDREGRERCHDLVLAHQHR